MPSWVDELAVRFAWVPTPCTQGSRCMISMACSASKMVVHEPRSSIVLPSRPRRGGNALQPLLYWWLVDGHEPPGMGRRFGVALRVLMPKTKQHGIALSSPTPIPSVILRQFVCWIALRLPTQRNNHRVLAHCAIDKATGSHI